MSDTRIVTPIVNLNGTGASVLLKQYRDGEAAAQQMACYLRESMPHGRDYQTAPPGTFEAARDQHMDLLKQAERMESYFRTLKVSVMRQIINERAKFYGFDEKR